LRIQGFENIEIISCFKPQNTHHNLAENLSSDSNSILFSSLAMLNRSSIHDLICSESDLPKFLSAMKRFFKYSEDNKVSPESAKQTISSLLLFFQKVFLISSSSEELFSKMNGFEILYSYISILDPKYLPETLLDDLIQFQKSIHSPQLNHDIIVVFLLNLSFLCSLPLSIQDHYFNSINGEFLFQFKENANNCFQRFFRLVYQDKSSSSKLIHSGIVSFDFFQKLKIKSIFAIS
jgi:hypothetical protein